MHACGHDMHVTCLLGAAAELAAARDAWRGTLLLVFQPAEEARPGGAGHDRRRPVRAVPCARHRPRPARSCPCPRGYSGCTAAPRWPQATRCESCCTARAGTGHAPETTVDPILMAAAYRAPAAGSRIRRDRGQRERCPDRRRAARGHPRRTSSLTRPSCCSRCARSATRCTTRPRGDRPALSAPRPPPPAPPRSPRSSPRSRSPSWSTTRTASARLHRPVQRSGHADARPRPGDRQRGRRPAGYRRGRAVRVLVPRRLRPGPVRGRHDDRAGAGHRGRPAVQTTPRCSPRSSTRRSAPGWPR